MCGLVAALSYGVPLDPARLEAAVRSLSHRGPDGSGLWVSADRMVAVGHTRLAIRDVAGGVQPMSNEDGRVVAAVNGELYDIDGLRGELVTRGHRFRSRSDSEVVVHAWEEWGPGLVDRLRGEFALVVWDAGARSVFAARDRLGVKPLLWAAHDGSLLIASQVCALHRLGLPSAWDHEALTQATAFQYTPPDATLFAGVNVLPAGHTLHAVDGRTTIRPYWELDYPRADQTGADHGDAAAEVLELFDEAVRIRLESDVPYAFQLSGGIDSAAVLASAATLGGPLHAFTVAFEDDGDYNELAMAGTVARHLGADLHRVPVRDRDVAESFPDAVAHAESACINIHAAAKFRLSRAMRDAGFTVALTGEGADEIFFGYAHLRADLAGGVGALTSTNTASAGLMLPDGEGVSTASIAATLGFVPTWIAAKAVFGRRVRELARDDWLARVRDHDAGKALLAGFDISARLAGRGRVEQSAYLWTRLALEGYILRALGDGLETSHGVEGRVPFLDHLLVDRLRRLPLHLKIRDGVEKWVLREAMRDRLPGELVRREKHPFLGPPIGPAFLAMAHDLVTSRSFGGQPVFDPARVRALLTRLPGMPAAQRKAYDPVLCFVVSIAVLQDRLAPTA
ncbi:asparagine synthase (glutamine-hydrolyzing) [Actinoplanes subglobosus]|uniref:asparagine synthase (glutamine-hydrolyzing) n=1 Tax=Actinoplanes subglobosus TaxID=1547892 RepID=A0ABV8IQL5_9ACTN